jgi:hypothetical protein
VNSERERWCYDDVPLLLTKRGDNKNDLVSHERSKEDKRCNDQNRTRVKLTLTQRWNNSLDNVVQEPSLREAEELKTWGPRVTLCINPWNRLWMKEERRSCAFLSCKTRATVNTVYETSLTITHYFEEVSRALHLISHTEQESQDENKSIEATCLSL